MKTLFGTLAALALCLLFTAPAAAKPKLHMIVMTDSGDEGIGVDLAIDAANYITLARAVAKKTGMTLKLYTSTSGPFPLQGTFDGETTTTLNRGKAKHPSIPGKVPLADIRRGETKFAFDKASIKKTIAGLDVSEGEDVIWFVYTGHGFRWDDQAGLAQFPALDLDEWSYRSDEDNGRPFANDAEARVAAENSIQFREVFEALEAKGARLTISITDSCNASNGLDMPEGRSAGARGNALAAGLRSLFLDARGYIRIASQEPGDLAYGDPIHGGVFTYLFIRKLMRKANRGKRVRWGHILDEFLVSCRWIKEDEEEIRVCTPNINKGLIKDGLESTDPQFPQIQYVLSDDKRTGGSGSSETATCSRAKIYHKRPKCDCPKGTALRRQKLGFIKVYQCKRTNTSKPQADKRPKSKRRPKCSEGLPRDGACVIAGGRLPKEFGRCEKGKDCRCAVIGVPRKKGKASVHCIPKAKKCPKGWRRGTVRSGIKMLGKKHTVSVSTCTLRPFAAKRAAACTPKLNFAGVTKSAGVFKRTKSRIKPKGFLANKRCPYWIDSKRGTVYGPATLTGQKRKAAMKAYKATRKKAKGKTSKKRGGKRTWYGGKKKSKRKKKK